MTGKSRRVNRVIRAIFLTTLCVYLLSTVVGCAVFDSYTGGSDGYLLAISDNWKIECPAGLEAQFQNLERRPHGEGIRYSVYVASEEPTEFIADFSSEKSETVELAVNNDIKNADFDIPEEYHADFSVDYMWKHVGIDPCEPYFYKGILKNYDDNMYIIYYPETLRLIFCENIF